MAKTSQSRRAGLAAFLGTTMEWYDFFIYGTASALIFGKLFFPDLEPAAGILASFATLGAGYVARPVGAVLFGHIGDRFGRKKSLVATMLIMGFATLGIGLLPTYQAIGVAAPVLLVALRMIQGVAVGGEWGGAVLIASEHAGKDRRVSAGAWVQQGSPAGSILATIAFLMVSQLPTESFEAWGWRVPFIASILLVVVGLVVRSRIEESPEFVDALASKPQGQAPLMVVARKLPLLLLLGMLCGAGVNTAYSFVNVFALNWGTTEVGLSRSSMLTALLIMAIVQFAAQPLAPLMAKRWSPIRVWVGAMAVSMLTVPASYMLVASGNEGLATVGLCLQIVPLAIGYVILAGLLVEAFPAEVRYTAISLSYQLSSIAFASTVPMFAVALLTSTGTIWSVSLFQMAYVAISWIAAVLLVRRSRAGTSVAEQAGQVQDAETKTPVAPPAT